MPRAAGALGRCDRKRDSETRSAALTRLASHRSPVGFDDVACDGEAQARPLPFRGEKRGKHPPAHLHPRTPPPDPHTHNNPYPFPTHPTSPEPPPPPASTP